MITKTSLVYVLLCLASFSAARHVNISVDASDVIGTLPPVARFFGADEPNQGMPSGVNRHLREQTGY